MRMSRASVTSTVAVFLLGFALFLGCSSTEVTDPSETGSPKGTVPTATPTPAVTGGSLSDLTPTLGVSLPKRAGWTDASGNPIQITIDDIGVSGATYECRAAPVGQISSVAFANCDGADGSGRLYRPTAKAGSEDGTYKIEFRVKKVSETSRTGSLTFYAHRSLNGAGDCAAIGIDQDYFNAAATALSISSTFGSSTSLDGPFVKVAFTGETLDTLSLRKSFILNSDRTLLLVRRIKESSTSVRKRDKYGICKIFLQLGHYPVQSNPFNTRVKYTCDAVVLNAEGRIACLAGTGINPLIGFSGTNVGIRRLSVSDPAAPSSPHRRHLVSPKTRNPAYNPPNSYFLYLPD